MISVVIPVYNDPEGVRDTLDSLIRQKTDQDYEIIPVDNNSADSTPNVIKELERENSNLINYAQEDKVQSSYAARNKGIETAKGDIICFIDADMWVDEDYIQKIASYFENNSEIDYMGCRVKIVNNSDTAAGLFDEFTGLKVEKYFKEMKFIPTCCLSVRTEVFENVGNFNQRLISGGDKEFGRRVAESEMGRGYADNICVYHPARTSWQSLRNKYFRVGRGDYQLQCEYQDRFEDEKISGLDVDWLRYLLQKPEIDDVFFEEAGKLSRSKEIGLIYIYWVKKISYYLGYQYERFIVNKNIYHA